MTRGVPLDREAIHRKIWQARDRNGRVRIHQRRFAEHMGLAYTHLNRVIREFESAGVLKKIGSVEKNVGLYTVTDPDLLSGSGLND